MLYGPNTCRKTWSLHGTSGVTVGKRMSRDWGKVFPLPVSLSPQKTVGRGRYIFDPVHGPNAHYFCSGYCKIIPWDFPSSWRRTDSARWSMKRLSSWAGRVLGPSPGEGWTG